jgi:hypothetical protein
MEHATQFPEQYSKVASVQKKVGLAPSSYSCGCDRQLQPTGQGICTWRRMHLTA